MLIDNVRRELELLARANTTTTSVATTEKKEGDDSTTATNGGDYSTGCSIGRRRGIGRMYDMTGHGVPVGLLRHLCDAARDWLGMTTRRHRHRHRRRKSMANPPNEDDDGGIDGKDHNEDRVRRRYDEISFANVPNATLLDTDRIGIVVTAATTGASSSHLLPSLPAEWEHDLEMYMVVMDRIGSRMATLAMTAVVVDDGDVDGDDDIDTRKTTGSIVAPSRLRKWDVTIVRGNGEAYSASSMVRKGDDGKDRNGDGGGVGVRAPLSVPTLSLEWARVTDECWKVVLRLHDRGVVVVAKEHEVGGSRRDSVSLVFEGEYVPP